MEEKKKQRKAGRQEGWVGGQALLAKNAKKRCPSPQVLRGALPGRYDRHHETSLKQMSTLFHASLVLLFEIFRDERRLILVDSTKVMSKPKDLTETYCVFDSMPDCRTPKYSQWGVFPCAYFSSVHDFCSYCTAKLLTWHHKDTDSAAREDAHKNRRLNMQSTRFEKCDGSQVREGVLQEASQLFSDHYSLWSEQAAQAVGKFAKAGKVYLYHRLLFACWKDTQS